MRLQMRRYLLVGNHAWLLATACCAALLYSSWPLAFWLNPAASRHDLASSFEVPHQPYNWVFIGLDILSGLGVVLIAGVQYRAARAPLMRKSIATYALFGATTAAAAFLPFTCDPGIASCRSLWQDPLSALHDALSLIGLAALFVSTVLIIRGVKRHTPSRVAHRTARMLLGAWVLAGVATGVSVLRHTGNNLFQYSFIALCSLLIILIVLFVEHLGAHAAGETSSRHSLK